MNKILKKILLLTIIAVIFSNNINFASDETNKNNCFETNGATEIELTIEENQIEPGKDLIFYINTNKSIRGRIVELEDNGTIRKNEREVAYQSNENEFCYKYTYLTYKESKINNITITNLPNENINIYAYIKYNGKYYYINSIKNKQTNKNLNKISDTSLIPKEKMSQTQIAEAKNKDTAIMKKKWAEALNISENDVDKYLDLYNAKGQGKLHKDGRKINSKLKAFADDFGFKITLCKPRHSYTKGKVESANKFVEWILPYDGEFENESDIIELLQRINSKVNQAPNQATNIPPILLFQKEKEYLLPLPSNHIIESYMNYDRQTKVHKDSLITYKGSKYSVPPKYIGKSVTLRRIDKELQIYFNTDLISTHQLSDNKINYNECDYKEILGSVLKNKSTDDIESLAEANLKQFDAFL